MSVMDRLVGWSGEAGRNATGATPAAAEVPPANERVRSLEATWDALGSSGGWRVRLPVRAEDVQVTKRTIVAERVLVQVRRLEEIAQVTASVRHEELTMDERATGGARAGTDLDQTERWPVAGDPGRESGASSV